MIRGRIKKYRSAVPAVVSAIFLVTFTNSSAWALGVQMDDVLENIVTSSENLPGLLTAVSYLLALLLGVTGILKLKDHVENSSQTPLRVPIIRFIIGGALLALPIIYETMATAFNGGTSTTFDPEGTFGGAVSALLGSLSGLLGGLLTDFNAILSNLMSSMRDAPGFITALAYLLAILLGVAGLLKIKDHVESPDQTPLREGVVRLLVGGALFALPTIYQAMASAMGDAGFIGQVTSGLSNMNLLRSGYGGFSLGSFCNPAMALVGSSLRDAICGVVFHAGAFPAFLSSLAYLFGLILGLIGILKIRDHVLNPSQTQIWEGFSRLIAGGMFFTLPIIIEVARMTFMPVSGTLISGISDISLAGYNEATFTCGGGLGAVAGAVAGFLGLGGGGGGGGAGPGLDQILHCLMNDTLVPVHIVLNLFSITAGIIFLMIGISRLTKSAQDGAKGPGGIGTLMTFIVAAALISYNGLMRVFTATMFSNPLTSTFAKLNYTTGMTASELATAHTVISAVLKFMILIGLISFVRGIFIIRNVAEGSQGASIMAGITHMVGGALAVNLGPLMNAVQSTLGITGFGISFT